MFYLPLSTYNNFLLKIYLKRVPKYLHNRPKSVVEHIMKRMNTEIENLHITQVSPKPFSVRSLQQMYQVWYSMHEHLCKCFEQKKIEMFPHDLKPAPSTIIQSHYVVSIYCICLKRIPGAEMVYCSVCKNWFYHGHPKSCIANLTAKQAAALATDAPFICEYCEIDKQKKKETRHTYVVIV